jgi:hypothetical protein
MPEEVCMEEKFAEGVKQRIADQVKCNCQLFIVPICISGLYSQYSF